MTWAGSLSAEPRPPEEGQTEAACPRLRLRLGRPSCPMLIRAILG